MFQLESTGMKQVLLGAHLHLEDIIALISLYRPGPMDSIPLICATGTTRTRCGIKRPSSRIFWT